MIYTLQHGMKLELDTIVLDLNGTLSVHGKLVEGVKEKLDLLKEKGFHLVLLTGDQRHTGTEISRYLGLDLMIAKTSEEKEEVIKNLGKEHIVSIGNARIDIGTFKPAKLSILTLQAEGVHPKTFEHVDIVVPSIIDALDLLLNEDSLVATLKE